ncbi:hypothetical protein TNCV_2222731 [Trichonephila clavipes]|nr:hypothetical protein TNCV_2222731 [Trichonephila clavipes]
MADRAKFKLLRSSALNPTTNSVLTIIEDMFGDAQSSMPILSSLLLSKQALNQELWCGVPFLLTVADPFGSH